MQQYPIPQGNPPHRNPSAGGGSFIDKFKATQAEQRDLALMQNIDTLTLPAIEDLRQHRIVVGMFYDRNDAYRDVYHLQEIVTRMTDTQKKFSYWFRRKQNPLFYGMVDGTKRLLKADKKVPTIEELFHEQLNHVDALNSTLEPILDRSREELEAVVGQIDQFMGDEKKAFAALDVIKQYKPSLDRAYLEASKNANAAGYNARGLEIEQKKIRLERLVGQAGMVERVAAERLVVTKRSRTFLLNTERFFRTAIETGEKVLNKSRIIETTLREAATLYQQAGEIIISIAAITTKLGSVDSYTREVQGILADGFQTINHLNRNIHAEAQHLLMHQQAKQLSSGITTVSPP